MEIQSAGPLTDIWIGDTLSCQVAHAGDTAFEWYNPTNQESDCGTRLYIGPSDGSGLVYGPASSYGFDVPWTPVSQSPVTGTGTSNDPFQVVTVVEAIDDVTNPDSPVDTGVQITQTDSYVVGEESYRTDIKIDNASSSSVDAILYRLGDCYLGGSDAGYGGHDASGTVGCRKTTDPNSRVEEWVPISSDSNYYESYYANVVEWPIANRGQSFPNLCGVYNSSDTTISQPDCDDSTQIQFDNGTGISWAVTVPPSGHVTRSELSAFSPTGNVPLTTAKTADQSSVPPDSSDGYTITVHNPNNSDVTLNDVTDNLPPGFDYVAGSSTDATTNAAIADPAINGQDLTWNGPFTVPAGGDFSLHFNVVVASQTGDYNNQASADAANNYSVAPTGPTATVTVTSSEGGADLTVSKTGDPGTVTAGNNVGYTIHVVNNGPDQATGVFLDDTVPPGATFVSASGTGWTCDAQPSGGHLTCDGPNLGLNEATDLTLVFKAPNPAPEGGQITNSVTVSDDQGSSASDGETTNVSPKDPDQSSGYVPPSGGTVRTGTVTDENDNTNASGTLPPGGPGGVVTIDEQPAPDNFCGDANCRGDVVVITIPDGYDDPTNAPRLKLTYDVTISSGAARIFVQHGNETPVRVLLCIQHRVANPSPCIGRRFRLPNGDQRVFILLLSGDPIFGKH